MADRETSKRIDRWIEKEKRNPFGDSKDTAYIGGTPLFDETTGKTRDRDDYILEKHPELRKRRRKK